MAIVHSGRADLTERIADGLRQDSFRQMFDRSKEAEAALDFVLLKLAGKSVAASPALDPRRPSAILISVDTLRADHLGCYGHQRGSTPTMDALAARGAVFLNAISTSSWTLPAHMSIFTSLLPAFHKLEKGGQLGSVRLDESEVTLAERLKASGYATAAFVAHPFLSAEWGFDRGFDLYRRYSTGAEAQTDRAVLWLQWHQFHVSRGLRNPEFFLFLHYIDPHEPYQAPVPYCQKYFPDYNGPLEPDSKLVTMFRDKPFQTPDDHRYALALYDGEINYVDTQLARLFQTVGEFGQEDSTLVILTSDHGEEFKDHGSMGHKETLYDEQLKVPLIIVYPRAVVADQKIAAPVSLVDIMPTVLDLTGGKPEEKAQGVSLKRYLRMNGGESAGFSGERHVFAELGPLGSRWEQRFYRKAVRTDRQKLIFTYSEDGTVTKKNLYRLDEDPLEQRNVYEAGKDTEGVRQLEGRLDAFVRRGLEYKKDFPVKNRIDIGEETSEHLRALGYVE